MSLYSMLRGHRGATGFGHASTAEQVTAGVDLSGETILITGINSGLGEESARVLHMRGARILGAARSLDKAQAACRSLGDDAVPLACELSEPASVRACVDKVKRYGTIDVILCNAGIMALPERTIHHGQELQFLTNHIGHFLLVTGLTDALADDGRVVMLSSAAHAWAPTGGIKLDDLTFERGYTPNAAYGQSKLANLLFARSLAKRFEGTKKTANAVHPGVIATNLARHMSPIVQALMPVAAAIAMKSIPQGAATQCFVAANPAAADLSGEYFADCNVARSSRYGRDMDLAEKLWDRTEEIVQAL
ncbi:MAG: SDR family NAD(P)-dependent oxidoreductase [Sandaracinaceae bacterium]